MIRNQKVYFIFLIKFDDLVVDLDSFLIYFNTMNHDTPYIE